ILGCRGVGGSGLGHDGKLDLRLIGRRGNGSFPESPDETRASGLGLGGQTNKNESCEQRGWDFHLNSSVLRQEPVADAVYRQEMPRNIGIGLELLAELDHVRVDG